jgi:putative membrane protein
VPDVRLGPLAWRGVHAKAFRRLAVRRLAIAALLLAAPLYLLGAAGAAIAAALAVWIVAASRLQARALAWGLGPGFVAFRSGFLRRATSATRFSKIQAVAATQSPFDRRHGTTTVSVDTAGAGRAQHRIRIPFLPESEARALVAALVTGAADSEFRW